MNRAQQALIDFSYQLDLAGINPIRAYAVIPGKHIFEPNYVMDDFLMYHGIRLEVCDTLPAHAILLRCDDVAYFVDLTDGTITDFTNWPYAVSRRAV